MRVSCQRFNQKDKPAQAAKSAQLPVYYAGFGSLPSLLGSFVVFGSLWLLNTKIQGKKYWRKQNKKGF